MKKQKEIEHILQLPPGILLIDKPSGMSSFDVIRTLRKKLDIKKMGHAGTLDPLAEGLMIIGVGKGAKHLSEFVGLDKTYTFDVLLGVRTDTGDGEGEVVKKEAIDHLPAREEIIRICDEMKGEIDLPVPRYSAVKMDGVPLYKRARRGETFDPPMRTMTIKDLEFLKQEAGESTVLLTLRARVGSGVYVRSIAEEVGRRLSIPAYTHHISRDAIGGLKRTDAVLIDDVDETLVQYVHADRS